ncbi:hypothetical protein QQ045_030332 [Rhodiola kirilowii]
MMKKRPSSSDLQIWTPEKKREPSRDSSFTLPGDWFVDQKTRTTGISRGTTDKYYHEPGTGHKFRSLVSVERYLMETGYNDITTRGNLKLGMPRLKVKPLPIAFPGIDYSSKSLLKKLSFKKPNQIVVYRKPYIPKHKVNIDTSKPLKLPDGWYIETTTRRSGHSVGKVDKYYCEGATGRVFRSLVDVQRYLADCYIEENISLNKLFKPAGLIQMSGSEEKEVDNNNDMAIVPHSGDKDSYSDISDDVLLKDLVRKSDNVPLKHLVRNADEVPLKDLLRKSADVPLKDLVRRAHDQPHKDLECKSAYVPLRDHVQKSDDEQMKVPDRKSDYAPLKDLVRKSSVVWKIRKHAHHVAYPAKKVLSCTSITSSFGNASNPTTKIKWVLTGPGGDDWSPFTADTMVPESLKREWAQMFRDIVGQKLQKFRCSTS